MFTYLLTVYPERVEIEASPAMGNVNLGGRLSIRSISDGIEDILDKIMVSDHTGSGRPTWTH